MLYFRRRTLAVCALPCLVACSSYGTLRMEFDSVTGFDQVASEPETLIYQDQARRWPWLVRQFEGTGFDWLIAVTAGVRPGPYELDNPSGFMRERMVDLRVEAGDDFGRMADVSHRVLWIAARDEHPLDQIVAIDSMEALLRILNVNPLAVPFVATDAVVALQQVDAALGRLEARAPRRRGGQPLDDGERRAWLADVRTVSAQPSGSASQGRRTIRTLLDAAVSEEDDALLEPTRRALADVMANEMSQAIRVKLTASSPDVREAALLALYRLCGPVAVPFSLRVLAARPDGGGRRYDSSESFRRTWVRLCSQLPEAYVFASYAGGPKPIEFLYDTVIADEESGLRALALDAMARALGRPVSFDRTWADEWWREYSLREEPEGER